MGILERDKGTAAGRTNMNSVITSLAPDIVSFPLIPQSQYILDNIAKRLKNWQNWIDVESMFSDLFMNFKEFGGNNAQGHPFWRLGRVTLHT